MTPEQSEKPNDEKQVDCPKCGEHFRVVAATHFKAAKFTYALKPTEGHAVQLKTFAGSLLALDKLMRVAAKELGAKIHVLITDLRRAEDGTLEVELLEAKEREATS